MSWPAPYFVPDATPTHKLDLLNSLTPVALCHEARGEIKEGTILIGKGVLHYRKPDRSLLRLTVLWTRSPELHASVIRLHPRIDVFMEVYSKSPDFVFYFADHRSAQLAHASMLECIKYPAPPPTYESVPKPVPAAPAIKGIAHIMETEKRKIEEEKKLTNEAFSDLSELMNRANEVMVLVKKCSETLSSQKDMDEFDKLLSDIGIVDNPVTKATAGKKYHEELAKQISIFLSQRKPPSVVVTLADVYALYNKARAGAGLVSPSDVLAACRMMNHLGLDFEFIEYANGVKAVRNKPFYQNIEKACQTFLKSPQGCLSAADLSKAVTNLPLVIAKEWLIDKENKEELVRDRDMYGNLRWFANSFPMYLKAS